MMRFGRKTRLAAAMLTGGVLAAAAGCSDPGGAGTSSGSAPPARTLAPGPGGGGHPGAAWPTYGRDFARSGVAADAARPGPLTVSWRVHLDGAVYGQSLLVGDTVIAATENDSLYALDQATGRVIWRRHVGTPVPLSDLPCGNIDPLGITGTPVYNPASGLVYAVAETTGYHHVLVGISVRDGAVRVERDIPTPDGQPRYDQQRPALAIAA
ncbi:MAG TPA: PQQ-binding-like beta-propeller repeat protein, partial [Streptosporangiaceae bacterium]